MPSSASIIATAYATVFVAELVGDRSLFAVSAMAARLHALPLLVGMTAAFMAKSLAAVLLGSAIGALAGSTVSLISAASFAVSAALLWHRAAADEVPAPIVSVAHSAVGRDGWAAAAPTAFSSVFFTEWADVGQLTTAALVAQYHAPLAVWCGASMALATKGVLALTLGVGLRRVVPVRTLRWAAIAICVAMAGVSLYETVARTG
jgi:Ca2+/H+ antiporter, TMEM165/GDT1 family